MDHKPVMLADVLDSLNPKDGEIYVDGTFGAGGYTRAFLEAADCTVVAIDRDPSVQPQAQAFKAQYGDRFVFIQGCFGDVSTLLRSAGFEKIDGFVLDLGVSSMQLDQPERGFSFRFDAPLDMRMNPEAGETAADILATRDEKDLADIIYLYGEERYARRIAKKIVEVRGESPIETTGALASLVEGVIPKSKGQKINPATRTFQALRIAVNDELGEVERALSAATDILKPGGRLVVVSFHSLEDRIVKNYMREKSGGNAGGSRHMPEIKTQAPDYDLLHRKALKPSAEEESENPRARSARLRAAIRREAAA